MRISRVTVSFALALLLPTTALANSPPARWNRSPDLRSWAFSLPATIAQEAGPQDAAKSSLYEATTLEQQGKLKEARKLYIAAAEGFRAAGDQRDTATSLSAAGNVSLSLGDYTEAINEVEEAVKLRQTLHDDAELGQDFNTIGRAYVYLGNYAAALKHYQEALKFDRIESDAAGEITRLNNIGNVYYFLGHYSLALWFYEEALTRVNATAAEPWNAWQRQLTLSNTAVLYQRLGLEERALELYKQLSRTPQAMPADEYGQLLLNEGVLYRRLGDPIKALELYHAAQALFRSNRHPDGEISALRNIGIARTADLGDFKGAVEAFTAALNLSRRSSDSRGAVLASLYLGEVLRRMHRMKEAKINLDAALAGARKAGLVEEQWKTLYGLGRLAADEGHQQEALNDYRSAISIIETVRAGLRPLALRSDFLADKRDVYDSVIALEIKKPVPPIADIFQWMERSRARMLAERLATETPRPEVSLRELQSRLGPNTVFVEFWMGSQTSAAVWVASKAAGIVRYTSTEQIRNDAARLLAAVQEPADNWRDYSRSLGHRILAGIPLRAHLILVPDGPLNIPFEMLMIPGTDTLLIEKSDVSFLPSARFISPREPRRWAFPWARQLVAFGDPPVSSSDSLAEKEKWQRLPASSGEVRAIAQILPGRAEIHLGTDARKTYLLNRHVEDVPLLHFSTHALVDAENPDRSRILLAPDSSSGDYLFLNEVYSLDMKGVGLVTLSACDTARGTMIRGEGVQAFSQAFLAAGASATTASLWKVDDGPTASFMKQFYYFLDRKDSKAEALRAAKLRFLRSNSSLSEPRYWAAFVLSGDGWNGSTRVVPWSVFFFVMAAILAMVSLVLWRFWTIKAARQGEQKAGQSQLPRLPETQTPG